VLESYRVIDVTDSRGHLAGLMLAMLGAEVIKVEPPAGVASRREGPFTEAGASLRHAAYDRGKASVVLDLDTEAGRQDLRRLIAGADCVIESQGPGAFAEMGLGFEGLLAEDPELVLGTVTAFGHTGPKAHWPVTDLTLMASGCTMAFTGDDDRSPLRLSVPQAFHFGAAVLAGGVVAALYERGRSGSGQIVDVAAQQVIPIATQCGVLSEAANFETPRRTGGGASVGPIDLRFVYPALDGYVSITHVFGDAIGVVTTRLMEWCVDEGFARPELAALDWINFATEIESGAVSVDTWEEAKAAVAACTASKTKSELLEIALQRRLLMAPIADLGDVLQSDQLAARDYFVDLRVGEAEMPAPGGFALVNGERLASPDTVASLGADTGRIIAEPRVRPASDAAGPAPARPLEGVKVVDFMWSLAGPFTSRVLADLGATVVKVESIHKPDPARGFLPIWDNVPGLEQSALFDSANAGKLSLALDMRDPAAHEVVRDLAMWADVLCESYSPRAMPGWGLDHETLRAANPRLVYFSTCLFGQFGPLSAFAGYGNLGAALSGFYGLAGWQDRAPSGPFGAYTDYTSTHFMAAMVVAALDRQRRTGEGCRIDLAQAEAALHFIAPGLLDAAANGHLAGGEGNAERWMAPHGGFPCAGSDSWIALAVEDDEQWVRLCAVMGRDDLAADPELGTTAGRLAAAAMLESEIGQWTSAREVADVEALLIDAGIAAHRIQSSGGCLGDPQLAERGAFVWVDHPERGCVVENNRVQFSRTDASPQARAPFLGEHSFEVLTEILGYDADRIADLAAGEVLE